MNVDELDFLLLNCIDRMKRKMIESAKYTGLKSEETIKCSQDLDILINQHMKYLSQKDINSLINAS
ncbi:aspartyl-phosphate phosphatase Spo0E family protein [Neobacillus sp. NRS-1170]|uniref:aspartyl-phosphate phosphatase Spo0E family protein n=1 Tax=Neobacillus sp. NRS-1170 TaxID=3233898 RepID=UPI003D2DCBE0